MGYADKLREKRQQKGRYRVPKGILYALLALEIVLAVVLFVSLVNKGILPTKAWGLYIGMLAGIIALGFISMIRKWSTIVMLIITALVCAGLIFSLNFSGAVMKSIRKVTGHGQTTVSTMQVAVLKSSDIESIEQLAGEQIGYASAAEEQEIEKIKADIDSKVMGVSYTPSSGVTALADALYDRDVTAIILNESYVNMLTDIDEYKNFKNDIRIIYSLDVEQSLTGHTPKEQSDVDIFTLYMSGIDTFGETMKSSRSDVNVLAVVNMKTKHILLVNTPRDYYVPLPNSDGEPDKLTHAGMYGVDVSMGTLENLYNTDINYYLRMNFSGFERIIDTLGGIDVDSDYEFTSTLNPKYHYEEGMNHLNGEAALFFARERYAFLAGDNQRGKDHMAIITAVVKKLTSSPELLTNYQNIFGSLSSAFQTSMPEDLIYKLVSKQIEDNSEWKIESYAVVGEGDSRTTFSHPNSYAYVTLPDKDSVYEARDKIREVLNER